MFRALPVTKRTGTLPLAKRLRASSQLGTWEQGSLLFSCVPVGFDLIEVLRPTPVTNLNGTLPLAKIMRCSQLTHGCSDVCQ